MEEEQLYICNRAKDPKCVGCSHCVPHEMVRISATLFKTEERCTSWCECYDETGNEAQFKVRCVKYHGE